MIINDIKIKHNMMVCSISKKNPRNRLVSSLTLDSTNIVVYQSSYALLSIMILFAGWWLYIYSSTEPISSVKTIDSVEEDTEPIFSVKTIDSVEEDTEPIFSVKTIDSVEEDTEPIVFTLKPHFVSAVFQFSLEAYRERQLNHFLVEMGPSLNLSYCNLNLYKKDLTQGPISSPMSSRQHGEILASTKPGRTKIRKLFFDCLTSVEKNLEANKFYSTLGISGRTGICICLGVIAASAVAIGVYTLYPFGKKFIQYFCKRIICKVSTKKVEKLAKKGLLSGRLIFVVVSVVALGAIGYYGFFYSNTAPEPVSPRPTIPYLSGWRTMPGIWVPVAGELDPGFTLAHAFLLERIEELRKKLMKELVEIYNDALPPNWVPSFDLLVEHEILSPSGRLLGFWYPFFVKNQNVI